MVIFFQRCNQNKIWFSPRHKKYSTFVAMGKLIMWTWSVSGYLKINISLEQCSSPAIWLQIPLVCVPGSRAGTLFETLNQVAWGPIVSQGEAWLCGHCSRSLLENFASRRKGQGLENIFLLETHQNIFNVSSILSHRDPVWHIMSFLQTVQTF